MSRDHYPMKGHPNDVLWTLIMTIKGGFDDDAGVDSYQIGRCGMTEMDSLQKEHDADDIVLVYLTACMKTAMEVEEELVGVFKKSEKCGNESVHGSQSVSADDEHCVYLAVWENESGSGD